MRSNVISVTAVLFACLYVLLPCSADEIKIGQVSFPTTKEFEGYRLSSYSFDLSPDEQEMVFVVDFSGYFTELWTARLDGSGAKRLYKIEGANKISPNYEFIFSPKYSPGGNKVGFVKTGKEETTLCVLDLTTGTVSNVLTQGRISYEIGWKDNEHIYFTKKIGDSRTLYEAKIDGTEIKSIVSDVDYAYPSPDWNKICLVYRHKDSNSKYYTMEMLDLLSMARTEIIRKDRRFPGHHPVWSPDGSALIFQADSHALRIGVDGGNEKAVTEGRVWAWSRDSRFIYLTKTELDETGTRSHSVNVYKAQVE